jgi:hypothetical protein
MFICFAYYENDPRNTRKTQKKTKKDQCNLRNLWFHLFHSSQGEAAAS